jgi:hypothetical protein
VNEDVLHLPTACEFSKRTVFPMGFWGSGFDLRGSSLDFTWSVFLIDIVVGREAKGMCVAARSPPILHSTGHQTCFPNSELLGRFDMRLAKDG